MSSCFTGFRFLTSGESHGPAVFAVIEGVPAGLNITAEHIDTELKRRQVGYGSGKRMELERDRVRIKSGIRKGFSTGAPITLEIENRDWVNWDKDMSPDPVSEAFAGSNDPSNRPPLTKPRPGHADLPGAMKYSLSDMRDVLERASARETAARCAIGALAKTFLAQFGVKVISHVIRIGEVRAVALPQDPELAFKEAEGSLVRCADANASKDMMKAIDVARKAGDTLGGIFEVTALNVPPGLGSYVQWDKRLDGRIARAMMALNGVKAVEIGLGVESATCPGSMFHDEIYYANSPCDPHMPYCHPTGKFYRRTNNAGGIEGGISNGEPIIVRAAMKPIATLKKPLRSVDIHTKESVPAHHERSDVCAVSRASVVGEALVAIEIMDALISKLGGDNMTDMKSAFDHYIGRLECFPDARE